MHCSWNIMKYCGRSTKIITRYLLWNYTVVDHQLCLLHNYLYHMYIIKLLFFAKHTFTKLQEFNSLAPGVNITCVIFKLILWIDILRTSCKNGIRWVPQDLTDYYWTFVQVMVWCLQAASHYLNQYWPKSKLPYGVTRPQWVKGVICNV